MNATIINIQIILAHGKDIDPSQTWRDIPISLVNALDRHALLACLSCKLSTAKAIASTTTVGNLADSIFIPSAVPDPRDDRSRRSDGSEIILNAPIGLRTDSGVRDIGVKRGEANGEEVGFWYRTASGASK